MKVLQICTKPPAPPVDGGGIAANNITRGLLGAKHQVKVLSISTYKHPFRKEEVSLEYLQNTGFETCVIDIKPKLISAIIQMLKATPYPVQRFYLKAFEELIINTLRSEQFDIVHLESLFLTPYLNAIRIHCKAPIVLRAHNIEHHIWQMGVSASANPVLALVRTAMKHQLKRYEISNINQYDGIVTITKKDMDIFKALGCQVPITDIPLGIDSEEYRQAATLAATPVPETIFHIGAMDWQPNEYGIRWFIDRIWPLIRKTNPKIQFHLAGRKMPNWLLHLKEPNIKVHGEVENAKAFMAKYAVMVVPLLSGSGLRVKIIEAMALGKPIVATDIGASGISCEDGKHILLCNQPETFANAVLQAIEKPLETIQIGKNAGNLAASYYDNNKITAKLTAFYEQLTG